MWFEKAYKEISKLPRFSNLRIPPLAKAHAGYFAVSKGLAKDTSGNTALDEDVYALIMRDKERILSPDEPLRFIFSHSALREGWDNPNVFQICTLNETKSEIKKRQEIGRGLRLPVDETGERCHDFGINKLTVIANESYEDFAKKLQEEIEEDCGVDFKGKIENKRERKKACLKKGWKLDSNFVNLWDRIKHKTRYSVLYDSNELVRKASAAIAEMSEVAAPKLISRKIDIKIGREGVTGTTLSLRETRVDAIEENLPDILSYLQKETEITRVSLARILIQSGRLGDMLINPQDFMYKALRTCQECVTRSHDIGYKVRKGSGCHVRNTTFRAART